VHWRLGSITATPTPASYGIHHVTLITGLETWADAPEGVAKTKAAMRQSPTRVDRFI